MEKLTTTTHRRPMGKTRRTIAAHVDRAAMAKLDALVERGVFVNRSHAVDVAIALLLRAYGESFAKEGDLAHDDRLSTPSAVVLPSSVTDESKREINFRQKGGKHGTPCEVDETDS